MAIVRPLASVALAASLSSPVPRRHWRTGGLLMRTLKLLVLAMALAGSTSVGAAGLPVDLAQTLRQMQDRLDRLEARNAELERQLAAPSASALETRVQQLESDNLRLEASLASEHLSHDEPELATRLKMVEADMGRLGPAGRLAQAVEGISAGGTLTLVAQRASKLDPAATSDPSQLSWRGDVEVAMPGGAAGNAEGEFFFHLRMGQGDGVEPAGDSPVNATAFDAGHSDPSNVHAVVAQAWYQLNVPLPLGGFKDASREHLEATFGKMDPYGFFDGNDASDDETAQYLNLNFIHNPLLDAGGGAVFDSYGFTPGMRLAYVNETNAPLAWGVSYGLFATGEGAAFVDSFEKPLHILQLERTSKLFGGLDGHVRVYGWHTGLGTVYDGSFEKQSGLGVSIDQRVGDGITLWGRYGQSLRGSPMYDRAVTLGARFSGSYWNRAADSLGVAVAHLAASDGYRVTLADPAGAEQTVELYYNWQATSSLVLTPDLQFIRHAAADKANGNSNVAGLRAALSF